MNDPECPRCEHFTGNHGDYGCGECPCPVAFAEFSEYEIDSWKQDEIHEASADDSGAVTDER